MKIVTYSMPRTGSTLVANILAGMFDHNKRLRLTSYHNFNKIFDLDWITFKTHGGMTHEDMFLTPQHVKELANTKFPEDVYFVYIHRYIPPERNIKDYEYLSKKSRKFLSWSNDQSNVLVLHYPNILYKSKYNPSANSSLEQVVNNIGSKLDQKFNIKPTNDMISNAVQRIIDMDKLYEVIKSKPFEYFDTFYHIHGSHRNRRNRCSDNTMFYN